MGTILETSLPASETYQSLQSRANLVVGALSAYIVMEMLSSVWAIGYTFWGTGFSAEALGINVYTAAIALLTLLSAGLYLSTVVLFLMWFHRAYKNLTPLGAVGLQYSPGWTIGAWFIPIGNLFIPYRIAKEIWVKSGERHEEYAFLNTESTVPSVIGTWWGFWIVSNISINLTAGLGTATSGKFEELMLPLMSATASILAAMYAIRMIKMLTARQEENIALMPNYGAPPPPPNYESQAA